MSIGSSIFDNDFPAFKEDMASVVASSMDFVEQESDDDQTRSRRWLASEDVSASQQARRVYFQYMPNRNVSDDDAREQVRAWIRKELVRKKPRIVLEEQDLVDPLAAVERVLFGDGADRTFFLSNCSTGGRHGCWVAERNGCILEDDTDCCLATLPCNTILIRPKKDLPSIARMFPGDEILAIRAGLFSCPHQGGGCVASIINYVWAPTCEARPFEREFRASFVSQETALQSPELRRRPDNLLVADILSGLPPISIETKVNLSAWAGYLDWRNRLVAQSARAIRYLRAQRNSDGSVSFFAVYDGGADTPDISWLRHEELEAVPLSASADLWTFREVENDGRRLWKPVRAALLGESDSVKSVSTGNSNVPEGCPWSGIGIVEVRIFIGDESRSSQAPGARDVREEDEAMSVLPKGVPETGFLRICQRGDRSLVERMKKTLDEFARNGSVAAPFLSSCLFDITQARIATRSTPIEGFLNRDLNDDQRRAVQVMLDAPDIALVQGPPGTGKTSVIAEAIYQFVKTGKTVLLASQSIAAVENALGRLGHVPEIRIQVCHKQPLYAVHKEVQSNYSDAEVLRGYYATLGQKARDIVSMIDQAEERRMALLNVADELEPLVFRIGEESETEREAAESAAKAGEEVRAAVIRAESADASRRAREASGLLVAALGTMSPRGLGEWTRDVPQSVIAPLADMLRTAASALAEYGIRLWSDLGEDEAHRPSDVRLCALAGAMERLHVLRDSVFPKLLECIEEWQKTTGERLMADESLRHIQELTLRLREVERLRDEADDNGNDEAVYQRYDAEARHIRRHIRDVRASAKTAAAEFREWFTLPCSDGRTLADAIEAAEGNRAAVLELVAGFKVFAVEFMKVAFAEESRLSATLRDAAASLHEDPGADAALREARIALRDAETLVEDARQRRLVFERSAASVIEKLRLLEHDAPGEAADALAWCRSSAAEMERRIAEERKARPWLEPMCREWIKLTADPNDEDMGRALPIYLANCNVVGTTCTANPRMLGDRHFDVVIVDEVSKATPPELIAPMTRGSKTILVGDHRQLPPLFDEKEPLLLEELAEREEEDDIPEDQKIVKRNFRKYERMVEDSIFKRHFEQADPRLKSSLWKQYRMHPEIMDVINVFYEGNLKCGHPEGESDRVRDHGQSNGRVSWMSGGRHAYWIDTTSAPDGSFFADELAGKSRVNGLEVRLILRALQDLDAGLDGQRAPDGSQLTKSVGVIAFYGKQKGLLLREIRKLNLRCLKCRVETVDRFQGQECDYVLVSMTRNNRFKKGGARSFIARFERINVAFSRARELLIVFGARGFFARQPVVLPSIDGRSRAKTVPVYGYITDMLAQRGAVLQSDEIISAAEWHKLPTLYTGSRSKPTGARAAKSTAVHGNSSQNRFARSGNWKNRSRGAYIYQKGAGKGKHPSLHR